MTSTRSRLSLLLAIATLVVAGFLGSQGVSAGSPGTPLDGSEPGSGGGFDDMAGICVAPDAASGAAPDTDCADMIDDPVVVDPGECGEKVIGTGPDAAVSYAPCPSDEPPGVTDPDQDAKLVEPTPGMADVRPHIFDHVVVNDDGSSVTVYFWSGVEPCYVLDHMDVDEGPGAVTITLFEGHDTSAGDVACIDIALLKKVVVPLDAPVGDRRIVDGAA
ncbi:MAG: hypothetical protein K0R20_1334 [Actinomycetia bacterium]|jgi:hypothetical protein|nr:hypothetical protein [Actinomycetes bacterium]